MKTSLIALLSAIILLASCSNDQKAAGENGTDTVSSVDTSIKVDTVKKDTVAVKKSNRETEEQRDQKIMDDILKKRKTMK
ncbi:hypothetical protein ABDD95_23690 (plasmid) [Mucilaginibacter sp. PAMB04274]|uniref:hypothetical protein n=1 Tax=Mucilaginibacter sp. PAMB04274 TaxID=3138568 RepID=UPI0031F61952